MFKEVTLAHGLKWVTAIMMGEPWQQVTLHLQTEVNDGGSVCLSVCILNLFVESGTSTHGMVTLTFRVGLLSSVKPLWKLPKRPAQSGCVS